MLLMHEVHRVRGVDADAFEAAYRDGWMPLLAEDDGARLLWYFNHAHGCGISFNVVTVTAIRDWPDWERLAARVQSGDLQDWACGVDRLRYGSTGALLQPATWSPLGELDLGSVPVDTTATHDLAMYVEDTIAPDRGNPVDCLQEVRDAYGGESGSATEHRSSALTELTGVFRPVVGGGRRRQIVLLQKVLDLDLLAEYYRTGEVGAGAPWSAGHAATAFGDAWSTKLLRAAAWSPWN
jgi:hypothetical protein